MGSIDTGYVNKLLANLTKKMEACKKAVHHMLVRKETIILIGGRPV